ncbi:MAG TPA: hypothetical protein VK698_28255 [Kofleriaceae bacterium]|nr:hypothetical protein [Kofleriaceae bacterium]
MGRILTTVGLWIVGRRLQRRLGGSGRAADLVALVALAAQLTAPRERPAPRITEPQSGVRLWG